MTESGLVGPAPAGVVPDPREAATLLRRRPRASGGGSAFSRSAASSAASAPRQRGWFGKAVDLPAVWHVGPAPAGVVRGPPGPPSRRPCRPRASGGGSPGSPSRASPAPSAPRQRGWFAGAWRSGRRPAVGPAPAGVVRPALHPGHLRLRRPRASGGGSAYSEVRDTSIRSAPRQRGWFPAGQSTTTRVLVGPAPAGVVLHARLQRIQARSRPRASGGGSFTRPTPSGIPKSAPRQRGWFLPLALWRPPSPVGPAPAGVVPVVTPAAVFTVRRPRASGGGSNAQLLLRGEPLSAPRQRGWFPGGVPVGGGGRVGPAPAGVVRAVVRGPQRGLRRPRASGGGSGGCSNASPLSGSAPRQRGWFDRTMGEFMWLDVGPAPAGVVLPASAACPISPRRPRASGSGSVIRTCWVMGDTSAPRQRGWFAPPDLLLGGVQVGPAPAGVVPPPSRSRRPGGRRPRASGGGSSVSWRPLVMRTSAPRQRGWFPVDAVGELAPLVGPAPAGVVPPGTTPGGALCGRPRASGGGSGPGLCPVATSTSAPRQRGWFRRVLQRFPPERVGPAPAGVVRATRRLCRVCPRRPRASGGGSGCTALRGASTGSAPRQRGWFDRTMGEFMWLDVGPAPAGVVLPASAACPISPRRPRASGSGSRASQYGPFCARSAPRQRGWFDEVPHGDALEGRPRASGGGSPYVQQARRSGVSARASGGGSGSIASFGAVRRSAPRQRGWFHGGGRRSPR